ncbi:hypothetical protein PM10SUCC1_33140 [Propionigenium maris DSM 9537]|uniref:Uncharacterized protein n=1 Tax=Propionigenium maris DSM 9537 TaxID=1123000 RepID=A0A9W6LQ25_9FUSO|nr:hypothetical protein [Propionigenium maris]GLI57800.1 hypothetical protein PM10SUCC1_33140 [Propionigenium maris DSM 9537]
MKYTAEFLKNGGIEDPNIDLSSGKLNFNIPLFNLSGVSPSYDLVLNYRYDQLTKEAFGKWNKTWTSGLIGMGWSINTENRVLNIHPSKNLKLEVNLLMFGGRSYHLIFKEKSPEMLRPGILEKRVYTTRDNKNLKIYKWMTSANEGYWEVIETNGHSYFFGLDDGLDEEARSRDFTNNSKQLKIINKRIGGGHELNDIGTGSKEYAVYWETKNDNYSILLTKDSTNQQRLEKSWNLSAIEDEHENRTKFYYLNELQRVGERGSKFTMGSYLYKISNANGNKILFEYTGKENEVHDSWEITNEPDGKQEQVDKLRVDKISLITPEFSKTKKLETEFYNTAGSVGITYNTKRCLVAIKSILNNRVEDEPPYEFEYISSIDGEGNEYKIAPGALKSITYPMGYKLKYTYEEASSEIKLHATDETWKLKNIKSFITANYILVSGKNANNISILRLHYWTDKGWREMELSRTTEDYDYLTSGNFSAMYEDIIFIDYNNRIKIYNLDENNSNRWYEVDSLDSPGGFKALGVAMSQDYIATFFHKGEHKNEEGKLFVIKKDKEMKKWDIGRKFEKEIPKKYFPFSDATTTEHTRSLFNVSIKDDLVVISKLNTEDANKSGTPDDYWKQVRVTLIMGKIDSFEIELQPNPFSRYGSTFKDKVDELMGENLFLTYGAAITKKANTNDDIDLDLDSVINIFDSYIEIKYKTVGLAAADSIFGNYNYRLNKHRPYQLSQFYIYDKESMTFEEHPIQKEFNLEEGQWDVKQRYLPYVPWLMNFSAVATNELILLSYTLAGAHDPGLSYYDNELSYKEHNENRNVNTKVFGYVCNAANNWVKLEDPETFHNNFKNKGTVDFSIVEEGVFAKSANVDINGNEESIYTKDVMYLVWDEGTSTFRRELLGANLPLAKNYKSQKQKYLESIENGVHLAEKIIDYVLTSAFIMLDPVAALPFVLLQAVEELTNLCISDAIMREIKNRLHTYYGSSAKQGQYIVNGNSVLFMDSDGSIKTIGGQLDSNTGGNIVRSYASTEENVIPFLVLNEESQKVNLYSRVIDGNILGDLRKEGIGEIPLIFGEYGSLVKSGNSSIISLNNREIPENLDDEKVIAQPYWIMRDTQGKCSGDIKDFRIGSSIRIVDELESLVNYQYSSIPGRDVCLSASGFLYDKVTNRYEYHDSNLLNIDYRSFYTSNNEYELMEVE